MDFIENSKERAYGIDVIISKQQRELTQKYILPIMDELMELITSCRKTFDREYLEQNSDNGVFEKMK